MRDTLAIGGRLRPQTLMLYVMVFCGQCDRTIYVMTISWLAIGERADLAAAGRVLVWWPLISLLAGPLMGAIVDRFNRRNVLILGQLMRIGAVAWLFLSPRHDTLTLHLATVIACLGALLSIPSLQASLKVAAARTLSQIVIGAILAGLAAEILGAVAAGFLIAAWGTKAALMACVLLGGAVAALAVSLRNAGESASKPEPLPIAALAGFWAIIRDPVLLPAALGYILAWATAQTTLALLPAFARFELHLNADAYGWIDAMWGAGGVICGAALMWRRQDAIGQKRLIWILLLLAMATAGFSAAGGLWTALVLHGLMGGLFTLSVATTELHIFRAVDASTFGRVRGTLQAAIGATGIAVFLLPTFQGGNSARTIYLLFSVVLAAAVLALPIGAFLLERRMVLRNRPRAGRER